MHNHHGAPCPEKVAKRFKRIDAIRSIVEMRWALLDLPAGERRAVILHALAHSPSQFTWSFFAEGFGILKQDWPAKVRSTT